TRARSRSIPSRSADLGPSTVALVALKIDVDTYRGTRESVPRLADLLGRLGVPATFLFSLGPDHTGRAIRRVFRRGFLGKVKRTSVVGHYGLKTLLYGVLLPGPHIGRRCSGALQDIARRGFEVGVHCFDHVRWQGGVGRADLRGVGPVGPLLGVAAGALARDPVFTLHAEREGGAYLPSFERLLRG